MEASEQKLGTAPTALLDIVEQLSGYPFPTEGVPDDARASEYLSDYVDQLQLLADVSGEANYSGLSTLCMLYQEVLSDLAGKGWPTEGQQALIDIWPSLAQDYLLTPETDYSETLISHLLNNTWNTSATEEDREMLRMLFADDYHALTAPPIRLADTKEMGSFTEGTPPTPTSTPESEPLSVTSSISQEISPELQGLLEVFLEELPMVEESLSRVFELTVDADSTPQALDDALDIYAGYVMRFGDGAGSVGFEGLHGVCMQLAENITMLRHAQQALGSGETSALQSISSQIRAYLRNPFDKTVWQSLLEALSVDVWPQPLAKDEAEAFLSLLSPPEISEPLNEAPARPTQALPEMVSLDLPADVNQELLEAMLQELPGQTEEFTQAIQRLTRGGGLEDVHIAQRIAHTLKDAGNTVGIHGVATLTHHLEDILVALAQHELLPTRTLSASLMNAADCLEAMSEALSEMGRPPQDAQEVLQEILDWANHIDQAGPPQDDASAPVSAIPATAEPTETPVPRKQPEEQPQAESDTVATPMMRVPASLVDNLLRMAGESMILTSQVHELLRQAALQNNTMQAQFSRLQRLGTDLETLIDVKDLSQGRIVNSDLDSLELDQYNELHTTSRMLVETATDAGEIGQNLHNHLDNLDELLIRQERQNLDLQEAVLNARMVPIKTIIQRLERSVRQTMRLTGKSVTLHTQGEGTLIDSDLLSNLIDPLMHILRNAVDHGIETRDQRLTAGKSETGNIWLEFGREGNTILVRCRDDGTGIDYDAIRQRGEERGLLTPGKAADLEQLQRLILMPNFSTRSEVTETSGRGIGLDMVYARVLDLGGSMNIESEHGEGCLMELRLPVSLLSIHALLVRLRSQVVAISDHGIEQILHGEDGEIYPLGGKQVFRAEDNSYPITFLEDLLDLGPDPRNSPRSAGAVLLVRGQTGVSAVQVQEVLETRDMVVKDLGKYIPRLHGITGATISGDGSVTPVLDLPELLRSSGVTRKTAHAEIVHQAEETSHLPTALVVEDSLSARRSLVQLLEDSGWIVREARDGVEAAELIGKQRPAIILTDLEMPRMNGLELVSHLRAHEETSNLPIIMITSRSAGKHREMAENAGVDVYLTKPFMEDELMEHVQALTGKQS
jgi:chemosensory pili system protein ChpA (sensor histidine kinase/response regulator)